MYKVQDYSKQLELFEVKPIKYSWAGTTETRNELSVDIDFVTTEI